MMGDGLAPLTIFWLAAFPIGAVILWLVFRDRDKA